MDFPPFAYVTTSIDVTLAVPRHHTDHGDGTISLAIDPDGSFGATYLIGTIDDLVAFAEQIRLAALGYETGTHPIGAAVREVADELSENVFEDWCELHHHNTSTMRASEVVMLAEQWVNEGDGVDA